MPTPGSGAGTTSYTVTGLAAGTNYFFRVRAVKGNIKGVPSNGGLARAGATIPMPTKTERLKAAGSRASGARRRVRRWTR